MKRNAYNRLDFEYLTPDDDTMKSKHVVLNALNKIILQLNLFFLWMTVNQNRCTPDIFNYIMI